MQCAMRKRIEDYFWRGEINAFLGKAVKLPTIHFPPEKEAGVTHVRHLHHLPTAYEASPAGASSIQ